MVCISEVVFPLQKNGVGGGCEKCLYVVGISEGSFLIFQTITTITNVWVREGLLWLGVSL